MRLMKKIGIYKIQSNIEPEKFYIGSSSNLLHRKRQHLSMLKNNNHFAIYLQNYVNKNGIDSITFHIIEECNINDIITREQFYLDNLKPIFNSRLIAESNRGHKFSDKVKKNMSKAQQNWRKNNVVRIKLTDEVCNKVLELKKQNLTNEEISKIVGLSLPSISKIIKSITKYSYKLTVDKVKEIKELIKENKMLLQDIAKEYDVNPSVISNIKAGRLHKNI